MWLSVMTATFYKKYSFVVDDNETATISIILLIIVRRISIF